MLRLILLLLAFGALALFVFQNVSPVLPLVVLGTPTIALPVGLWVLGAIAAGGFTSILIAGLIRLAAPRSSRRSTRRSTADSVAGGGRGPSSPSGSAWSAPTWAAGWSEPQDQKVADAATREAKPRGGSADDWEKSQPRDDWDDWAGASASVKTSPGRKPPVSSYAEDNPFRLADEEPIYQEMSVEEPVYGEREVWDDWEEEAPQTSRREEPPPPPPREIVEVRRNPQTESRSGTIYSYTYRRDDEPAESQEPAPPPRSERVVDADFRVITPPNRPDPEPPATSDSDEADEWDDWEYESDTPPDEPDEPDEPYQNPPLNLGNNPRRT